MDNLTAQISIQEFILGPNHQEKPPKTGHVSAGITIKLSTSADTSHPLKITSVESKFVKFHLEDLRLKSKPDASGPIDFELAPLQSDVAIAQTPEGIHEFKITVVKITPKTSTQPIPRYQMPAHYFDQVQDLLKKMENELSSKVMVYYIPGGGMITQNDPDYFTELLLQAAKYPKISLILHSSGGDSMASLRIATLLRHYCEELNVIIPSKATSAATLLSLSADKILFSPLGYLGPIDTQLVGIKDERLTNWTYSQISSDSFRRAREMLESENKSQPQENRINNSYSELFKHIHPLVVAEIDRLSSRSKQTANSMLRMHRQPFDDTKIEWLANHLVYDYPSHGYPILFEEAKNIGLNAEMLPDSTSDTLWELMKYYRAITLEKVTSLNTEWFHVEHNQVVIEAVGKRIVRRYSFDRKLAPIEKRWQTINDNSNWKKYLPPEKHGGQPRILNVEMEEKSPSPPEIPAGTYPAQPFKE